MPSTKTVVLGKLTTSTPWPVWTGAPLLLVSRSTSEPTLTFVCESETI
jgi:hypothetical protein